MKRCPDYSGNATAFILWSSRRGAVRSPMMVGVSGPRNCLDAPRRQAAAIRTGQGELATRGDLDGLAGRIGTLQWVVGINLAIGLATLAAVLAMAFRS